MMAVFVIYFGIISFLKLRSFQDTLFSATVAIKNFVVKIV